jgi:2',3'-cyclic-nucleotide 2'-phosphodiesterase (5'-nucleotidase family)
MKKVKLGLLLMCIGLLSACVQSRYAGKYEVKSIESSRIAMDKTWDAKANPDLAALIEGYTNRMATEMNVPVGTATQTLQKGYPQSLLSNFTADALQKVGEQLWGNVDFSIMNMGGLRAPINKGTITVGNLYEVYPFENRLVLLELPGSAVKAFFDFIAFQGGEGMSGTIKLDVRNRAVASLTIGGKPIDAGKTYRVVTIDYLAEGNDGMVAFKQATQVLDSNRQMRDFMIEYIQTLTANNTPVNATIDNRITVHN